MRSLYSIYRALTVRIVGTCIGLLLILAPMAACSVPSIGSSGSSSQSNILQFTNLPLDIPAAALNSPVVGPLPDSTVLHIRVTFKLNANALKQAQDQPIQPGQPSHLEQFANKIGIDDATYQKIKAFFSARGFTLQLNKLHTHLAIDAKAGTVAKALQTAFVLHRYNGRTFFAPDVRKPPRAPQFLVNNIDAITGLDSYSTPPTHNMHLAPGPTQSARKRLQPDCYPQDQTLLPRQVAHAYGFDQLWNRGWNGQNMTVNLVEIDGSYKSDIQNYLDCISFKGKLQIINVDGHPSEALGESTLDIQMVAGLARAVNINVYQTDGSRNTDDIWINVNDMLQQLINDNVNNANAGNTVSISLGAAEGDISSQDMRAIDSSIRQLTQVEHMMVFVASGDCGAFTSGNYGQLSVSFPASDPWAVSVGGTILQIDGQSNRANEIVWSDGSNTRSCKNRWGSGGGVSRVFQRPNWQSAPGVRTIVQRQLPDVSAAAYALAVYFQGQWGAVGGTSAAAPIWAAGLSLINQGLLQQRHTFNPSPGLFYQVAENGRGRAYYDVTRGNNLYYSAGPGWDYATGLGTPNLAAFYQVAVGSVR